MNALQTIERLVSEMTRGEKAELLQLVARDLGDAFPGVESHPEVCGGATCIVRTRIPVWVLEKGRRSGMTEADLLRAYPALRAEDLVNAWSYARAHKDEIDREVAGNEAA
jgi:uncharacterized protein (DUF433 family)